jgi:1,4-alpha-glucan branching enzyme
MLQGRTTSTPTSARFSRGIPQETGTTNPEWRAIQRGMSNTSYEHFGAHTESRDGVAGTRFLVWAPDAQEVCVIGDFNQWKHGAFFLNSSDSGNWYGFIPGVKAGDHYKYSLKARDGAMLEKADPYGFFHEQPPHTASIVWNVDDFQWNDDAWMVKRRQTNWLKSPLSTYEVHLASWKRPWDGRKYHTYRELAVMLVEYVKEMGYTHIQLMPITEYPFDGSWGYQSVGYFSPTSRFGTPDDFQYFVDYLHQHEVGVFIDWVPGHFPTDAHSLGRFDGTALYEHADPRKGFHPDWNTYIFNYGRFEVRNFLLSSARFWLDVYHIDGLRVDAVASMLYLDYSRSHGEWIPNQYGGRENIEAVKFLQDMNVAIHAEFPGALTIAEESTSWPGVSRPVYDGGLGFTMKWDMGWMNDTLRYLAREPVHRQFHQNELSFRSLYQFTENFVLPLSHDEVVHGKNSLLSKMPGDRWQQFANARLLYSYQFTASGKPLQFMGAEIGQWTEWNHDSQLDWELLKYDEHSGLQRCIKDLNRLKREHRAFHELDCNSAGFSWISADDGINSIYSWVRFSEDRKEAILVVMNMTPVPRMEYTVGVPIEGDWQEIFNSDARLYGGTDVGNGGLVSTDPVGMNWQKQSLLLTLPPLGLIALKSVGPSPKPAMTPATKAAAPQPTTTAKPS